MHFAGLDVQVDAVEGPDSGEGLGDAGHGEQRWFWCHDGSPWRACGPVAGQGAYTSKRVQGVAEQGAVPVIYM
ncbi:hypothetical protein GCM10011579_081210 [Streptomyces albiflavescens]|uniref:Uncharacterized protein n=1 Tax=Streptomyces albiflavescens TaxID=1623582 RepID=A0A917YCK8_9ACTN|nr:hypothetical protein GCM10011579_081210 [Streptomyces albiflavescens]